MDRKHIITACAGILLAGLAVAGFIGWRSEHKKVEDLQARVEEMKKQEMRSAIDRSVSAQMESIANEQREISDEKREEALQQTRLANEMRLRSEAERLNALEAERNAVASEKKALEASAAADQQRSVAEEQRKLAEQQQQLAEHQRIQAEFSKNKADTLSYIALGRSLGSMSTIQAQAGNNDIACLLSYASYLYTSRYGGDIYYPAVFQSLMQSSQSKMTWTEHAGAVMNLEYLPGKDNALVSVSNYGEITLNERQGNRLISTALFKNSKYDFRDVIIDSNSGNIYAVSRTGHLVCVPKDKKTVSVLVLDKIEHPMRVHILNDRSLLIVGERALGMVDLKHWSLGATKQLPFRITYCSRKATLPLLFDDQGGMHLVKGIDNYDTKPVPVAGKVTAYCESKNTHIEAYGMSDGTIWIVGADGKTQELLGHQSRISKMKLNGRRLYSASYDGTVILWVADKEKVEPMTLLESNNWLMHFNFDSSKSTFWVGDAKGNLTVVNISVPIMIETIRKKLKRNLTTEEWNYFIGENVPYETFVEKRGRRAAQ